MHGGEEEAARERRARNHWARAEILALLGGNEQGLMLAQIRAALARDLSLRNVYYHLGVLESCRLIVEQDGRYRLA
jgi:hypothetical protein